MMLSLEEARDEVGGIYHGKRKREGSLARCSPFMWIDPWVCGVEDGNDRSKSFCIGGKCYGCPDDWVRRRPNLSFQDACL